MWATIIGSHLTREPTASPVFNKWWNWELTLATNFGSHAQMVTKFGFVPVSGGKFSHFWHDSEFPHDQYESSRMWTFGLGFEHDLV